MKRQNRTTWVSTSSFRRTLDTLAYFSSQGRWARVSKIPLYPRFLHSLVRGSPRDSLRTSLSNYNKAMSHESRRQNRTTWVSTSSFRGLWTPLPPIFLSGKIGQKCPKSLYTPDFCMALLGDRPEILSGRPP